MRYLRLTLGGLSGDATPESELTGRPPQYSGWGCAIGCGSRVQAFLNGQPVGWRSRTSPQLNEADMPTLNINGQDHAFDVPDDMPLLWVLRDVAGLTGTKFGCGVALCGCCTVHLDGQPIRSCVTAVHDAVGHKIVTIEAIGDTPEGAKIQEAWLDLEVVQCGYCQSWQIMSATALLTSNPKPTDDDIDVAMSGNICRCGTYPRIRAAIKHAATI